MLTRLSQEQGAHAHERVFASELKDVQAIDDLIAYLHQMKKVFSWKKGEYVMEIWHDCEGGDPSGVSGRKS